MIDLTVISSGSSENFSDNSSDGETFEDTNFSPEKPKIEESSINVLEQIVSHVTDNDFHDAAARCIPVLARPPQGLNVNQLFSLMLGMIPANRICKRKPTSVTIAVSLSLILPVLKVLMICVLMKMVFGVMVGNLVKGIL
jgi:hypothetical protein